MRRQCNALQLFAICEPVWQLLTHTKKHRTKNRELSGKCRAAQHMRVSPKSFTFLLHRRSNGILVSHLWRKTNRKQCQLENTACTQTAMNRPAKLQYVRISRARWHCDSYYIRSTDGCPSRRRRSSRQRTTEKERNDKMIKSSESEAVNSPSHVLFILSNSERWRCLCLSHSMVYVVHLSRANWRASPTYTLMHSPTRCRWFLGAFAAHTKPTETIHMRTDDRTNGGENVARATTIRYAIFRMNLFKSIQNGQPNVAHAIHSLSL